MSWFTNETKIICTIWCVCKEMLVSIGGGE